METGRSSGNADSACNTDENRFYYDPNNHTFRDDNTYKDYKNGYDVTQVRPNDGIDYDETISQPSKTN